MTPAGKKFPAIFFKKIKNFFKNRLTTGKIMLRKNRIGQDPKKPKNKRKKLKKYQKKLENRLKSRKTGVYYLSKGRKEPKQKKERIEKMLKFPSKEKIAAMPKVIEEKEMEIRGEYADQIHVRIAKYSDGKIRISFKGVPASDIRQNLKKSGYTFDGIWWTGMNEIKF